MERNSPSSDDGFHFPDWYHLSTKYILLIFLFLFLLLSLSGCISMADPEASQVYTADRVGVLDARTSLGQSFVSRRPNLNSITVWVTRVPGVSNPPDFQSSNTLTAKLYLAPDNPMPVYFTSVTVPATGSNQPITIKTPNLKNKGGQGYYLTLSNASSTLQINGRSGDAYPLGQAFINGVPTNADMAFQLGYDYGFPALVSDLQLSIPWLWLLGPLLIIIWLPGWLLLEFSGFRFHYDYGEQTALSIGLSLAFIPVLMLWTTVLKIKWTSQGVYFFSGVLVAFFFARIIFIITTTHKKQSESTMTQNGESCPAHGRKYNPTSLYSIALFLIFLVTLAIRLIMVRDLATPAWVDSVHHALITRLIMDNGSFPSTYQPYLDFASSAYHPGFHSVAAVFTWLSKLDLARSLLILGQILNALIVFPVYLLTNVLTRSRAAGLGAAIFTGFLTPMPAYYTSWGRYTELTGLLLLPVILAFIQTWIDGKVKKNRIWMIFLGALAAGGLFMIHYRVLVFMACLIFSTLLIYLIQWKKASSQKLVHLLFLVGGMATLGIVGVLPWFVQTVKSTLIPIAMNNSPTSVPFFQDFSWPYLTSAYGKQAMAIAGLGLAWGVVKRKRYSFIIIIWILLIILLVNLGALRLPGAGLINTTSFEIMLFIPISVLGGHFISEILMHWKHLLPSRLTVPAMVTIGILSIFVAYFGAGQLIPILNPVTILSRNADLPAIEWVNDNIPQDDTIVINPFAWGYGLYAGNDGGYWISPLTGRFTLPPPVLYGLSKDANQINQLVQKVIDVSSTPAAFSEILRSNQIQYIYIGARGGIISPDDLANSGLFNVLYHQLGVWILSAKP